ncbi:integrin alpha-M-like isoform X1 [Phyllopteryx taeniolatus]|uniref:integrin alpha-M-like isoform X1 n=2 Tax=Phyllopteryx taeniolatus TaxID=161469 RepID=UPI002AD58C91|nr:integrin alpha-M-like isoform X1 [Phyllopteryx taeniolatus]XP_061613048.1 integrin alpha-M-like isoform X1 [Phyllopteryx taeniolatus]
MDWLTSTTLIITVYKVAVGFNIDPVAWKTLRNPAEGFGYQIVQRQSELLVSAPLAQYSQNRRGQIFKCSTESCSALQISVPGFAVNMSLGLSMTTDPSTKDAMVCGPTIPKDCGSITMYNGVCLVLDSSDRLKPPIPSSLDECRSEADIAFLLDGSGSVDWKDFEKMKTFVINLIGFFVAKDSKFAIVQFSNKPIIHYNFNNFNVNTWRADINGIRQLRGATNTAKAIRSVMNDVFSEDTGSRPNVKKILIVITDGESSDSYDLVAAVDIAKRKNIVRFAIGVGSAFEKQKAKRELNTIASSPSTKHVFQVQNFNALDAIQQTLQDSIFAIEGSQSSGEKLKMEMAQRGFSAAFIPGGVQIASVGANEWRGGFQTYMGQGGTSYLPMNIDPDSYLGYSITVAQTRFSSVTVLGAPRYQHRGVVMVISQNRLGQTIDPFNWQYQIGEYFGAVVCAMDVNRDKSTDVILISAPMFVEDDREGRVYVCNMIRLQVECRFESPVVLRGAQSPRGRFGSSLAILPDLNSDGLNDLAVGAPLEDDGQGSVYIFHGERRGISTTFSQRIAGSEFKSRLRFFGMSISQSSADLSRDGLPDLAVGSKGTVTLLRSKPIVLVESILSYTPKQVTTIANCDNPKLFLADICFMMSKQSNVQGAKARVNYTLTLDANRKVPNNRAYISDKNREKGGTMVLDLARPQCLSVKFYIEPCPEDALNPLHNELRLSFEGLPAANNLSPSLAQQAQMTTIHLLAFEIDCGKDKECVDDLKLDFNFSRSLEVKVGIDELLNVTVSVENLGENSYNTLVVLTYPAAFSYRKFTVLQGRVECNSLDGEGVVSRGKTDCTIDKPIFRSNSTAVFVVSYGIETESQLDNRIYVTANATSGNERHSALSQLYKVKDIGVKYSIFVTMESSLRYINFTYGKNDMQKSVQQSVLVSNNIRAFNVTVVIRVPVKLGEKDIWANLSTLQIPDCQYSNEERAKVINFVGQLQKNKIVDCSVATCRVFKCNRFMGRLEGTRYTISANMSAAWIQQIGLDKAKYIFTSTVSLEYDKNQYIFFSTSSINNPPVRKIETEVEVYPQPDFTKEIVGGSLGGVAILVILSAVLYKAGFFKSKYKEMINDADGAETDGAVRDEATLMPE